MSHIIILAGGDSGERAVSLRSGAAVAEAATNAGYSTVIIDPANGLDTRRTEIMAADAVFPALHGKGGEDGTVQAWLDTLPVPYVGSGETASALCFDKWEFKQLLQEHGVLTPKGTVVTANNWQASELIRHPFVLKPLDGGSSIDTFIVREPAVYDAGAIADSLSRNATMLLEELIAGQEVTAGVFGDKALPIVEIIPPENEEFDFANKYNDRSQELCPATHVSATLQQQAETLALHVHRLAGCQDLSRTDIIITPSGQLYVLETNTIPGLTNASLLPKAARAAGFAMPVLIDTLIKMAIARGRLKTDVR